MPTLVKLKAFNNNLHSLRMGLQGLYFDINQSIQKTTSVECNSQESKDRAIRAWIRRSISEHDEAVLNYGTPPLKTFIKKQHLFERRDMLWEHWGDVRDDALQKHGIINPGIDATGDEILKWCSDLRHILADVSRFEGMAARVSGRTKIKKLIAEMEESGGLTALEQAWANNSEAETFDITLWLSQQEDIEEAVAQSQTSKEKKEILLFDKRMDKLTDRVKELELLKTQLSYWISCVSELFATPSKKVDLADINWFVECLRQWTSDAYLFCSTADSIKKPESKLLKRSYASLK